MSVGVRSYGTDALLVELDSPASATALRARLRVAAPAGVLETMPGLRTVLVRYADRTDVHALARQLGDLAAEAGRDGLDAAAPGTQQTVTVRVDYRGPDLADVAAASGLSVEGVVAAHQAATYRVALIGMAPGFYFLSGGDPRLDVARRPSPRERVQRGAVGLAGTYTGIYPKTGPGGWQLIGRAVDDLWRTDGHPAALLVPGATVQFVPA